MYLIGGKATLDLYFQKEVELRAICSRTCIKLSAQHSTEARITCGDDSRRAELPGGTLQFGAKGLRHGNARTIGLDEVQQASR